MRTARTPYVIPIARAFLIPTLRRIGFTMARQMAKTNGVVFNVIGHRLDDDPVPMVYIGPTQSNIDDVIEPKVQEMLENSDSLWEKTGRGQDCKKHAKLVAGVMLRLGWAGSSTQLKADAAGIAFVDELDGIEAERKGGGGEGSVVDMAEAVTSTYPEGKIGLTSTPTIGNVEPKNHPDTGLEHWAVSDSVVSPVWRIWQEGSRHEWSWPCPDCREYFIPRFKLLKWPTDSTAEQAEEDAGLACPHCGVLIGDEHRPWMNDRGVMVAPGQKPLAYEDNNGSLSEGGLGFMLQDFTKDGAPALRVPWGDFEMPAGQRSSATFWVSGLATFSAKKTYGFIAGKFLRAVASGEQERVQGVINTDLGELFRVGGEAPPWTDVMNCAMPYQLGERPADALFMVSGVDVQKRYLVYVIRAFAPGYESWLVDRGELWGETDQPEVWAQLEVLLQSDWSGMPLARMLVDSGYRSEQVYEFCRTHKGIALPTKGHDSLAKPYHANQIDVTVKGKTHKKGLQLWHFDSDVMKSWVHGRINRTEDQPGGWHLPQDIDEDYCKQIINESRVVKPSGRAVWIKTGPNHFLDAEALAYLAARISGKVPPPGARGRMAAGRGRGKRGGRGVRSGGVRV